MSSKDNIILAFDLYGTLLSTESIAQKLGELYGTDQGKALAATWRTQQLEYTWRFNSMNQYIPFSSITSQSLTHTLSLHGLQMSSDVHEEMMRAYDSLATFPDVGPALETIGKAQGITPVVFSNGTHAMVRNSVTKSPSLAQYQTTFKDLVTVEEVKRFKPDPQVYKHLAKKMGKDGNSDKDMGSMWLVSGNPFDVVGARAVGMQAAWVDRTGAGWTDCAVEGEKGRPTVIVKSLGEVVDAVKKHASK